MAQTQSHQLPPTQSFSPPASNPSPGAPSPSPVGGAAPPPKRQRLSPHPQSQSPYQSPGFATPQPLQAASPVNGTSVNGMAHALASAPAGSMGPPQRPAEKEKPTDTAELTDVLASSGIDVKEEEAALTRSYANTSQQPQQLHVNTSFSQPTPGAISPAVSFNESSQHRQPYPQNSFYGADTSSQRPSPYKPVEVAPEDEKLREDGRASHREQYHMQSSFLFTKLVERRLQKRGNDIGVRIPTEGILTAVPGRAEPVEVSGPDGSSVVRNGNTLLNMEAPLVDIISLLSLSCEERLRTVLDNSSALAYNRQSNSHGVVPSDWQELAAESTASSDTLKNGTESGTGPKTSPLKRTNSMVEQSTGAKSTAPPAFAQKARKFMEKDSSYEEGRAAKRARRSANAILGSDSVRSESVGPATSGASTPAGTGSERAPDVEKKVNKKEMKKQAEAKATEAVQHQHAVETARMATSSITSGVRFGGKKKEYNWLKKPALGGSGFSTPSRINTAVGNATPDSGGTPGASGFTKRSGLSAQALRGLGDWREDGEKGKGVQIRDILYMLELDGRGVKNVQRGYSQETKEDRE
ncbi:hypothetical protein FQN54_001318 [Arachnomyces sp. PD_36]|nr:hypothetical protein FQN54_001318 [Arachnomyces sp. PD_36]